MPISPTSRKRRTARSNTGIPASAALFVERLSASLGCSHANDHLRKNISRLRTPPRKNRPFPARKPRERRTSRNFEGDPAHFEFSKDGGRVFVSSHNFDILCDAVAIFDRLIDAFELRDGEMRKTGTFRIPKDSGSRAIGSSKTNAANSWRPSGNPTVSMSFERMPCRKPFTSTLPKIPSIRFRKKTSELGCAPRIRTKNSSISDRSKFRKTDTRRTCRSGRAQGNTLRYARTVEASGKSLSVRLRFVSEFKDV